MGINNDVTYTTLSYSVVVTFSVFFAFVFLVYLFVLVLFSFSMATFLLLSSLLPKSSFNLFVFHQRFYMKKYPTYLSKFNIAREKQSSI